MKTKTRKTRFFDAVLGIPNARSQQKMLIAYQNGERLSTDEVSHLTDCRTRAEEYKVHSEPQGWHNYTNLVSEIISNQGQPAPEPERGQKEQYATPSTLAKVA